MNIESPKGRQEILSSKKIASKLKRKVPGSLPSDSISPVSFEQRVLSPGLHTDTQSQIVRANELSRITRSQDISEGLPLLPKAKEMSADPVFPTLQKGPKIKITRIRNVVQTKLNPQDVWQACLLSTSAFASKNAKKSKSNEMEMGTLPPGMSLMKTYKRKVNLSLMSVSSPKVPSASSVSLDATLDSVRLVNNAQVARFPNMNPSRLFVHPKGPAGNVRTQLCTKKVLTPKVDVVEKDNAAAPSVRGKSSANDTNTVEKCAKQGTISACAKPAQCTGDSGPQPKQLRMDGKMNEKHEMPEILLGRPEFLNVSSDVGEARVIDPLQRSDESSQSQGDSQNALSR